MTSEEESSNAPPKALTAAEKRALRRAKVLQQSEKRLNFLKGSTLSLKEEENEDQQHEKEQQDSPTIVGTEATMDEPADAATCSSQSQSEDDAVKEIRFPRRVDPATRRREAAARRKRNEAQVEELLHSKTQARGGETDADAAQALTTKSGQTPATVTSTSFSFSSTEQMDDAIAALASASTEATPDHVREASEMGYSRENEAVSSSHLLALRISTMEKHIARLLLALAALALAFSVELGGVSTGLSDLEADPVFASYQELISQGIPLSSIRQQMEREKLDASVVHRIEGLFEHRGASAGANGYSSWQPSSASLWDLPSLMEQWMAHPPLVVVVLGMRILLSLFARFLRFSLKLPHVQLPADNQFGFVADLFLANRPGLKDQLVILRNTLDDLLIFLYLLVLLVASRALVTKYVFA